MEDLYLFLEGVNFKWEKGVSFKGTNNGIHSQQVRNWRRQFLSECHGVFAGM